VRSLRERVIAYLRRTEGKLVLIEADMALSMLMGVIGVASVRHREGLLDEAVDPTGPVDRLGALGLLRLRGR